MADWKAMAAFIYQNEGLFVSVMAHRDDGVVYVSQCRIDDKAEVRKLQIEQLCNTMARLLKDVASTDPFDSEQFWKLAKETCDTCHGQWIDFPRMEILDTVRSAQWRYVDPLNFYMPACDLLAISREW